MRRVMQGAFVLTIASFIAKVLSALYRIPPKLSRRRRFLCLSASLSNLWDSNDFSFIRSSAVHIKVRCRKKESFRAKASFAKSLSLVFWTGVFLWLFVFAFSSWIAWMMGDIQLKPLIQVVSFTFC